MSQLNAYHLVLHLLRRRLADLRQLLLSNQRRRRLLDVLALAVGDPLVYHLSMVTIDSPEVRINSWACM